MIWTVLGTLTLVALLIAPAPSPAQETAHYGSTAPIFCTVTSLGVPGGSTTHQLAITWLFVNPQTTMAGYFVGGVNATTGADFTGYGHSSAGPAFPISISGTDGPTAASPIVRHWRFDIQATFTVNWRVVDALPNGNGTATGAAVLACQ